MTWARCSLWLLIPCLVAGCSGGQSTPPASPNKTADQESGAVADRAAQVSAQDTPAVPHGARSEAAELARELAEVTRAANEAQSAMNFSLALGHWQRAVEILTRLHGPDSWHARNAREFLQVCEIQANFDAQQQTQLKQLMGVQEQIARHLQKRTLADALALSKEATAQCGTLYGTDSFLYGKQLTQRGRLEQMNGNLDQAITFYSQSIALLKQHLGEPHPDLEAVYGFLAETYVTKKDLSLAIENYKLAARMAIQTWGENSLEYAIRANDLGVAFHRLRDLTTAAKILRTAETIRREKLGNDHPQVGHSLYNLGVVYLDLNRHDQAAESFEQALRIFKTTYPGANRLVSDCQNKLATTWMLLDKPAAAEPLLNEILTWQQNQKSDRQELALAQYRLAIAFAKQRKFSEAEPLLVDALTAQEQGMGPNHINTIRSKNALATLYAQTNRREQAERLASQVKSVGYTDETNTFQR